LRQSRLHLEAEVHNIANGLVEQGLDVINAQQMTIRNRIRKKKIQPTYLPFFGNFPRAVKSQAMFKMVNFCDISIKREPQKNPEWPEVVLKSTAVCHT
jgi:hypothetical protein